MNRREIASLLAIIASIIVILEFLHRREIIRLP